MEFGRHHTAWREFRGYHGVENVECTENGSMFIEELIGRAGQL